MGQYLMKLRRHLRWKKAEVQDLVITVLVIAFIFAYNDKQPTFTLSYWLFNYLKHILIMSGVIFVYDFVHKAASLFMNFTCEYKKWSNGLLIGVIVAILSGGKLYVVLPGGIIFHHMVVLRLGHFRYGLNYFTTGFIAAAGPLALLLVATFFKTLALFNVASAFFNHVTFICLYFAIFAMLPFPRHDGTHMFFANRNWFIIILFFLIGYIFLFQFKFYSLIFAALIGLVVWLVYYVLFERGAWNLAD